MKNRRGFTLIEMMVAVTILLFIMGAAVQYLRRQTTLVTRETSRMDALQNAGFAGSQIERELREAGAGVVDVQPMLVQIDNEAITFNANMVSLDTGDVRAVYQLTDADPNAVRAMLKGEATALPNSNPPKMYPDTTYFAASGVEGGAETISYWLRPDSTSKIAGRFVLFRRVNAQPQTLVARGLVRDATTPIFTYYTADTLMRLQPVDKTLLPIYHTIIHGRQDDTGLPAKTDSIRAVKLHFLASSVDPRTGQTTLRSVDTFVRLMNSGLVQRSECGNPPLAPSAVVGTSSANGAPVKTVTLTWTGSGDELSGERDIERYAIFRRLSSAAAFADPIASIPSALKSSYTFVDTQVQQGQTYVYGVSAQDCTPKMSDIAATSLSVTVNP